MVLACCTSQIVTGTGTGSLVGRVRRTTRTVIRCRIAGRDDVDVRLFSPYCSVLRRAVPVVGTVGRHLGSYITADEKTQILSTNPPGSECRLPREAAWRAAGPREAPVGAGGRAAWQWRGPTYVHRSTRHVGRRRGGWFAPRRCALIESLRAQTLHSLAPTRRGE